MQWILRPFRAVRTFWRTPDPMMWRQAVVILAAAALLALTAWLAWLGYGEARFRRHTHLAEKHLREGRMEDAMNFIRLAGIARPEHPEVYRLMADFTRKYHSPLQIDWLRKLVAARPDDPRLRLELAAALLRDGDLDEAGSIARALRDSPGERAQAENLLGIIAQRTGRRTVAGDHFRKAAAAAPDSPVMLANLAAFLIAEPQSTPAGDAEIEALLQRLSHLPSAQGSALRQRIVFLESRGRSAESLTASMELVQSPNAVIEDWIRHLELVARLRKQDYPRLRAEVLERARATPSDSLKLLAWLVRRGAYAEAGELIAGLPAGARMGPLLVETAEFHRRTAGWDRLEGDVNSGNWKGLEAYRLVYAAELAAAQGKSPEIIRSIQFQAIQTASSPGQLFEILARTADWPTWKASQEPLLVRLASDPTWRYAALQGLAALYLRARQAEPLLQVEKNLWLLRPGSWEHRLRFASLALLLGRDLDEIAPVIEALATEFPDDPRTIYLRARYLHVLQREDEALRLLESVPDSIRFAPDFALFTAQIYAAHRDQQPQKARALAQVRPDALMDAETDLLNRLKNKVQPGPIPPK